MRFLSFVAVLLASVLVRAEAPKAWIGLSLATDAPEGCAHIREVFEGSAGAAAGLKGGDQVCAIDGKPVPNAMTLIQTVRDLPVGTEVKLTIEREGKRSDVTLRLSPRPEAGEDWIRQQRVGKPVGELAPKWLQGKPDAFAKKVTLLDFWEPWCGPCLATMPALKELQGKHEKDLQILSIATDGEESIQKAMREHGMTWPVGYDAKNTIGGRLLVTVVPTLLIVDRDGVLRDVLTGRQDAKTLEAHLAAVLAGKR